MLSTFFFYSGFVLPSLIILGALVVSATLLACYVARQLLCETADFIGLSKIDWSRKRGGIGLQVLDHGDRLSVVGLAANSPAQKSGIQVGDVITHINGSKLSDFSSMSVSSLLGDEDNYAGTRICVYVQRPGERGILRFVFTREPLAVANRKQSVGVTRILTSTYQRNEVRASTLQTDVGRQGQNAIPEISGQTNAYSALGQDSSSHHVGTSS